MKTSAVGTIYNFVGQSAGFCFRYDAASHAVFLIITSTSLPSPMNS